MYRPLRRTLYQAAVVALLTYSSQALAEDNLSRCLSGEYASLCNKSLLTTDQLRRAEEAERRSNLSKCLTGEYPALCKKHLLSADELQRVEEAERRVNYSKCATGQYPALCKKHLLTPGQLAEVETAERRVNFSQCSTGQYPALCKRELLTSDQLHVVVAAERRVNLQTCLTGNYPALCKREMLSDAELAQVEEAEGLKNPSLRRAVRRAVQPPAQMVQQAPAVPEASATRAAPAPLVIRFPKGTARPDDVAVIIGNSEYANGTDIPAVPPAANDAALMRRYAIEALGIPPDNVIWLPNATGIQLAETFGTERDHRGRLFNWVKPGKSRVLVYYSGHGAPAGSDAKAVLVPSDASASQLSLSGYPLDLLYANLAQLPAQSVAVLLEACFSGLSPAGTVIPNASPVSLRAKTAEVPPNMTVITAGAADQIASWEQDRSHGLFTKHFLLGQGGEADKAPYGNGDGKVGLEELRRYLDDKVTYLARRYYGREQNVQIVKGAVR